MNRTDEIADAAAANWATRLDAGPLTIAEEQALAAWLGEDEKNQARMDNYRRIYARLGEVVPRLVEAGRMADPLDQVVVRPAGFWFRRVAGGLAAAAAIAVAVVWWTGRPLNIATTVANRQAVILADGSRVDLNAQTVLAVRMRGRERQVELVQGEAFFAVAKDMSRPFVVQTPAGVVQVTGTAFNVRSLGAGNLEVTVVEGSVKAAAGVEQTYRALEPDDQLSYNGVKTEVHRLPEGAARDLVAWREGRLILESERLDVAVERFARYHGRKIEVSPAVADLELGGRFRLDDLESFLRDIATVLPVQVFRSGTEVIRVGPQL